MDIEELKRKKKQLTDDIRTLVKGFETETGVEVENIWFDRVELVNHPQGKHSIIGEIDVEVRV